MLRAVFRRELRASGAASLRRSLSVWPQEDPAGLPPMTKIVATIGPASEQADMLQKVVSAGMRVMRLNFSHATFDEADMRIRNLRKAKGVHSAGRGLEENLRAVMLDTKGPEIRTGNMAGGELELTAGGKLVLTTDPAYKENGTPDRIFQTYDDLPQTVEVGSTVLLDDGLIRLTVTKVSGTDVTCTVENGGKLSDRRGVNLPGAQVNLPPMSDKDKTDIAYGVRHDVDFIAASFVRKASDVVHIRDYVRDLMAESHPEGHPHPLIISKIESTEAIENFEEIMAASDGIMVARGDLGVEIPMERVTNAQKEMVRLCNEAGKPVIVATQMLESMIKNPRPTRAEVADVTNAVYDGADAVMLSGESAKGRYPVDSVQFMRSVIGEAERWWKRTHGGSSTALTTLGNVPPLEDPLEETRFAMAQSAVLAAERLKCSAIIVNVAGSRNLAQLVSRCRPSMPIVFFTDSRKVGRQSILLRGVHPVLVDGDVSVAEGLRIAKDMGFCTAGDSVAFIKEDAEASETSSLRISTVA